MPTIVSLSANASLFFKLHLVVGKITLHESANSVDKYGDLRQRCSFKNYSIDVNYHYLVAAYRPKEAGKQGADVNE